MLLDRIGDRDVKLIRREGQRGGISLLKQDAGLMLPGEADEFPVPIQAEDLRLRIPPVQRPGQSAGTAADFQDRQFLVPVNTEDPAVLLKASSNLSFRLR